MPIITTAGWSIAKTVAASFPEEGSGLSRYASIFNGVEINSTFYRRHKQSTFARWAASVPEDFRFSVKIPKEITHVRKLVDIKDVFESFLQDIAPLDGKRGPLLCQLPPSLAFDPDGISIALDVMRSVDSGPIVMEARHKSWASDSAVGLLDRFCIGRVLADPAPVWPAEEFQEPPLYVRLHGKPKIYYSNYDDEEINFFAERLTEGSWCVFDNTASGAAIENALIMLSKTRF
ncbi:DUF72 domain-containing protein [Neorhizobium lilium]|uniref:DUF72 domain-containing protein n=1 Tax=Neorhizobium lilium TaxID=2503024 RepID=A0A3S3RNY5_9HYPH|nr:DUF72 domain-containing protein [Neorhizobium lilium]RWX80921.1 DUF72 domain-containing protein [Neorhizobium lilium]